MSLLLMLSSLVFAATPESWVPGGQVVQRDHDEVQVRTAAGSVVELDLDRAGEVEEASGHAATRGDVLQPGGGLLSLEEAVAAAGIDGPIVEWSLDHEWNGWLYEFEAVENGQEVEIKLDARDGALVSRIVDEAD